MCLRRDGDIVQGHAHSQHQQQSAYNDNAALETSSFSKMKRTTHKSCYCRGLLTRIGDDPRILMILPHMLDPATPAFDKVF